MAKHRTGGARFPAVRSGLLDFDIVRPKEAAGFLLSHHFASLYMSQPARAHAFGDAYIEGLTLKRRGQHFSLEAGPRRFLSLDDPSAGPLAVAAVVSKPLFAIIVGHPFLLQPCQQPLHIIYSRIGDVPEN